MKKILVLALVLLAVFFIYLNTIDRKVYYLALGDSLALGLNSSGKYSTGYTGYVKKYLEDKKVLGQYVNNYANIGYRSTDLKRDIEDNKKLVIDDKNVTIKNALIKADLVTLSIGFNDFFYYLNNESINIYARIDEAINDMDELLKLVREYCKENVIVIGYYVPFNNESDVKKYDNIIKYANKELEELCNEYKMEYVDVYSEFSPNYLVKDSFHPNDDGYKIISQLIIKMIDRVLFK